MKYEKGQRVLVETTIVDIISNSIFPYLISNRTITEKEIHPIHLIEKTKPEIDTKQKKWQPKNGEVVWAWDDIEDKTKAIYVGSAKYMGLKGTNHAVDISDTSDYVDILVYENVSEYKPETISIEQAEKILLEGGYHVKIGES